MAAWQFWMDRGGTFTDIVAKKPDGSLVTHKLLSENPAHYKDAAIHGIRELLEIDADQPLPVELINEVKMGTTVATNALLERKGEPTLLVTSHGLGDILKIGYQTRPDIFALDIRLPEQLYVGVEEASERLLADGTVDLPFDEEGLAVRLIEWRKQGIESIAIAFAHGYRFPGHEKAAGRLALELGFTQVSLSHEVSPLVKLVPRGDTTVVDAYLSPILRRYVQQVDSQLSAVDFVVNKAAGEKSEAKHKKIPLYFMQSNGGLVDAHKFRGKDAILSGPAGGVVGMVETASDDGFDRIIGFDMGGTSTDVAHYNADQFSNQHSSSDNTENPIREYEREFETQVAGVRLRAPMMNIHTVAAGGGSIVKFSDGRFQVGPESAGAFPGPACYRNGGPLTITDCNVLLGKVKAEYFPECFGPKRDQGLDFEGVKKQFDELAISINQETGLHYDAEQIAQGFLTIAIENMANAVKKISLQRGYDVSNYILNAFGGAGAQHACLVAEALGMSQVYLHPFAGVLSAYGIGLANERWLGEESLQVTYEGESNTCSVFDVIELHQMRLQEQANGAISRTRLSSQSELSASQKVQDFWRIHVKYKGTDTPLLLSLPNNLDMVSVAKEFHQLHQQTFGFSDSTRALIFEALQLERVVGASNVERAGVDNASANQSLVPIAQSSMTCQINGDVKLFTVPVYRREALPKNTDILGPALIAENNSTIVIEPNWVGNVIESGALILTHNSIEQGCDENDDAITIKSTLSQSSPDAIQLEVFNNLFMFVAEQMGFVLEKTAASVNIKERLDFSCALFDQYGELVANAPHIPVHLGSMSESIKVVINNNPNMKAGDAFVLNTPYNGGTHLPDITIVKPVFIDKKDANTDADFYVAARGHHADVGGITPGSMPARSQHINEEGILLDNLCLVKEGEFQTDMIKAALSNHEFPARNIEQNIADLKAQLAACEKGAQELNRLSKQYGLETLHSYMGHVQDNAELTLKACLKELDSGSFEYPMDDGSLIKVAITIDKNKGRAKVDFTGTSDQHSGNFNAPTSVAKAAVLYVFRCLVNKAMPLNAGFFRSLDILVPKGSMLAPEYPAAVVSGNVETAQTIVDTLLGALGIMAASQGTNNNFTFGDDEFQYYETLCGGAGATQHHVGASGVHTHMTNSRLTDVEILEQRFPVMLKHFAIRRHSGGEGKHSGGDGIERHIEFLKPMCATIISGHREVPTFGMNGGEAGKVGMNYVQRFTLDDHGNPVPKLEFLKGCTDIKMNKGDVFCIHTPGGGGYGCKPQKIWEQIKINSGCHNSY
ncbi:MAG: 5-oxoprolinase [Oleispira sp.]|nr:5-oxoprolinase [Oleispira sp.]